jgi:hypothetical protein
MLKPRGGRKLDRENNPVIKVGGRRRLRIDASRLIG